MRTRRRIPSRAASVPRPVGAALILASLALSALLVASWLVTAAAHVDDGYGIDHVAGTWMALAAHAGTGTLYPPLYDGTAFGGTRFMPIPILLQAAAADVSGEYLVSAKLLSFAFMAILVSLTFGLLRRGLPTYVAALLASTLLVSGTGLVASTSVRNDVLPIVLQLAALTVAVRRPQGSGLMGAALLCSLAMASKLSAVWAPLAIAIYLLRRDRRRSAEFAGAFAGLILLLLVTFELASGGRLSDNIFGLSLSAGERRGSLHDELARLRLIGREGFGLLAVLPVLAVLETLLAARERQLSPNHVAFVAASAVTAVVLLDPGAFVNHLLDVHVLSLFAIAELWRRATSRSTTWLASAAIVVALLMGSAASYGRNVDLRAQVDALTGETVLDDRVPRLEGVVEGDTILSEDPFVPLSNGHLPIVLDPFMLVTILDDNPSWRSDLVRRIERAEFDSVVLLFLPSEAPTWYRRVHFGEDVISAVERRYRPATQIGQYWVYERR